MMLVVTSLAILLPWTKHLWNLTFLPTVPTISKARNQSTSEQAAAAGTSANAPFNSLSTLTVTLGVALRSFSRTSPPLRTPLLARRRPRHITTSSATEFSLMKQHGPMGRPYLTGSNINGDSRTPKVQQLTSLVYCPSISTLRRRHLLSKKSSPTNMFKYLMSLSTRSSRTASNTSPIFTLPTTLKTGTPPLVDDELS